ncbi:MAG: Trigger factor [uncultured Sulfurimonas sp.]|nr:MAG: Trigger factor [uncultured Sulfurimonas sp.]CAI6150355.1 MAG: Trigger factor [uncultured Sulfurimonas sp.]
MEIKSTKIDSANAEITATISMDEVNANLEKIAKQLSKTASIQGFRKGKVPVAIVKKQYGQKLVEDAEAESLREVFSQGLLELNISNDSLMGEPNITKFEKTETSIEVVVKVATRPSIELGDLTKSVPDFKKPTVSNKDVEARIKQLAEQNAPLVDIKRNRKMKDGDTAVIDFEGSIDGVLFDGGAGKDHALLLGSNSFIPGFEDQLIGVKRDEELVVKVTFPENYGEDLAGKDAEFKVKVTQIQVKEEVEVNDELAKTMMPGEENASVETLTKEVKAQLEYEALGKLYNEDLKPKLLDALVNGLTFDLPEFVVEQEIDMALNKKAGTLSEEEVQELRDNKDKLDTLRETLRDEAMKSVRATFIIDAIAKEKAVKIEEQEVMQTVYREAMQMGQDPQKAYEHYKDSGYLPAIQMSMVEDRVLSGLLNDKIA